MALRAPGPCTPGTFPPAQIHWFSIVNSCVTVLLLTGFLATILMRVRGALGGGGCCAGAGGCKSSHLHYPMLRSMLDLFALSYSTRLTIPPHLSIYSTLLPQVLKNDFIKYSSARDDEALEDGEETGWKVGGRWRCPPVGPHWAGCE